MRTFENIPKYISQKNEFQQICNRWRPCAKFSILSKSPVVSRFLFELLYCISVNMFFYQFNRILFHLTFDEKSHQMDGFHSNFVQLYLSSFHTKYPFRIFQIRYNIVECACEYLYRIQCWSHARLCDRQKWKFTLHILWHRFENRIHKTPHVFPCMGWAYLVVSGMVLSSK